MRIHLGHHFYGAGNLGDDFMLAGFIGTMRALAPAATFTSCVPFALAPLRLRFPEINWLPDDAATRTRCIAECDAWLGLGGSPFQSAQSRWFIDHLLADADLSQRASKPMFYLGVGAQTAAEIATPEVRRLCSLASGIWTRDDASAARLRDLAGARSVESASDLAHLFFRDNPPPPAHSGRLTLVANFDYATWPGQAAALRAARQLSASERVWLAQESRDLPGAERALFAALDPAARAPWRFVSPERPGAPLRDVLSQWPSGEWLITARYHAALAGAWSGSKIVVIATNEKLRAAAHELDVPSITPDADEAAVSRALATARPATPPRELAERALAACTSFLRAAGFPSSAP